MTSHAAASPDSVLFPTAAGEPGQVRVRQGVRAAIAYGLALAVVQVCFAWTVSGFGSGRGYVGLCAWDSWLYGHIAEHGYRSTIPPVGGDLDRANVMFFPGYPLLARVIGGLFGLPVPMSLLLTAQLSAWGFWTCLLLFFQRLHAPPRLAAIGVLAVIVHPAAFFLVVGYSESLFMLGLLGFLYWSDRDGAMPWLAAAIHGLVMTATRIAGLPLAFYPVFHCLAFGSRHGTTGLTERLKPAARRLIPCTVASLGALAFFAFCQWKFGHWDLYMQSQRAGWQVEPDYLGLFQAKNYVFFAALLYEQVAWPDDLSRLSVLWTMGMLLAIAGVEYRLFRRQANQGWQQRCAFYLCGLAIFFVHASGVSSLNMRSMIRYTFATHVFLVLAAVQLAAGRLSDAARILRKRAWWLLAVVAACWIVQAMLIYRFTHGQWVA